MTTTEVLPDDAALRRARRARVLAEMEAEGIDLLVVGRGGERPLRVRRTAAVDGRFACVRSWLRARAGNRVGPSAEHVGRRYPR